MKSTNTPDNFQLNAEPDTPDIRDLIYQPALIPLKDEIIPPKDLKILDQGTEGACTGFGLAASINYLNQEKRNAKKVSARMLYEMARKFDEWDGDNYSGSSCRGAMRGWQNMGVCENDLWQYVNGDTSELNIEQAKNAHFNKPGAYYRLMHRVEDFHAALNEVGVLYVSATVHKGWYKKNIKEGVIPFHDETVGGHAFSIVGYDERGFYVQNSWGDSWGNNGIALWTYEDWFENITDAWVVRLAISTPIISTSGQSYASMHSNLSLFGSTKRHEIKGHFVHIDDGEFHTKGQYFSSLNDVKATAELLTNSTKYKHIVLYAHGGLNSTKASAKRIAAMKNTFKENGIYPYHFMYDTGLFEELKDIILKRAKNQPERSQGLWDRIVDKWDKAVENSIRSPGRAFWREMKQGATSPFTRSGAGLKTLEALFDNIDSKIEIHIVGHSTGAILMAHLLKSLAKVKPKFKISTCSLMAPACTVKDYNNYYEPLLKSSKTKLGINQMTIYNLTDDMEKSDTVTPAYRKSLLYLVSNSFEEKRTEKLLGMQKFCDKISHNNLEILYSDGEGDRGKSEVHGGFDNDPNTMNDILKRILSVNKLPMIHFTKKNLDY
jgi:hypothetical protein